MKRVRCLVLSLCLVLVPRFLVHHSAPSLLFMYLFLIFWYIKLHRPYFSCTCFSVSGTSSYTPRTFHVPVARFLVHHSAPSLLFMYRFLIFWYIKLHRPYFSCTCFSVSGTSSYTNLTFHVPVSRFLVHHSTPSLLFMYCFSVSSTSFYNKLDFHVPIPRFLVHHLTPSLLFMYLQINSGV